MPIINVSLTEDEYEKLQEQYHRAGSVPTVGGTVAKAASFEEWIGARITARDDGYGGRTLDELRIFSAIEKLITSLRSHDFGLAHLGRHDASPAISAQQLAQTLVRDLDLPQQQLKRIQDLLEYYSKSAKETADLAHVGVTNRCYGALHEAYRELVERTGKAVERLGEERAIGRVEGAIAILVHLHVMDRQIAKEKAETFKAQARNFKK